MQQQVHLFAASQRFSSSDTGFRSLLRGLPRDKLWRLPLVSLARPLRCVALSLAGTCLSLLISCRTRQTSADGHCSWLASAIRGTPLPWTSQVCKFLLSSLLFLGIFCGLSGGLQEQDLVCSQQLEPDARPDAKDCQQSVQFLLQLEWVNLLCFDEAHHATKKHPYALVMNEFYFRVRRKQTPLLPIRTLELPEPLHLRPLHVTLGSSRITTLDLSVSGLQLMFHVVNLFDDFHAGGA